ncbi:hypothetical protein DKX38_026552 [Salix brachista]|uniref:Uncharacterized protein n=1 Tax=Salix brachista TaxID=2182728 RepID=A0A5N5JDN0_9ROSI|nr:hypothetical protein DKX38_026552 [Salix brachista]
MGKRTIHHKQQKRKQKAGRRKGERADRKSSRADRENYLIEKRDHYWALMEELKIQYREYYWKYGVSPLKEDNQKQEQQKQGGGVGVLQRENEESGANIEVIGENNTNVSDLKSNHRCLFVGYFADARKSDMKYLFVFLLRAMIMELKNSSSASGAVQEFDIEESSELQGQPDMTDEGGVDKELIVTRPPRSTRSIRPNPKYLG